MNNLLTHTIYILEFMERICLYECDKYYLYSYEEKNHDETNCKTYIKRCRFHYNYQTEEEQLKNIPIYQITEKDNDYVIIDSFIIIKHLNQLFPELEFQLIGLNETIVQVTEEKASPQLS